MATDPHNLPARTSSAIQSLPISPAKLIPAWVDLSDLDAQQFHMPQVPPGQGDALRAASNAYLAAQRPSDHTQRQAILGELRLKTISRNEGDQETIARFRLLCDDLADVPADTLRQACKAYANTPGARYFPTAGELRAFTGPLMTENHARAYRLKLMAKESDKAFRDEDRCTPEQAAAILAEFGIKGEQAKKLTNHLGPPRNPTREDYIAMGVDPNNLPI